MYIIVILRKYIPTYIYNIQATYIWFRPISDQRFCIFPNIFRFAFWQSMPRLSRKSDWLWSIPKWKISTYTPVSGPKL